MDVTAFFNSKLDENKAYPEKVISILIFTFFDDINLINAGDANALEIEIFELGYDYSDNEWALYIKELRYVNNPINGYIDYIEIDNLSISINSDSVNCVSLESYVFDGSPIAPNLLNHFFSSEWWYGSESTTIFGIYSPWISISGDAYIELDTPWNVGYPLPIIGEEDLISINNSYCL